MKKFIKTISQILLLQEIFFRSILVIFLTFFLFTYYIILIPFLHIYKFLKSGLETMDETQGNMVMTLKTLYEQLNED